MSEILIVDDEDDLRTLMASMLSTTGYHAVPKADGEEALAYLKTSVPDLIVCDIRMPGISGYDVLQRVRKDPRTALVPFIVVTGVGDRAGMRKAMEEGADDFIPKPFSANEFVSSVQARMKKFGDFAVTAERRMGQLRDNIILALPHELRTPLNGILGFSKILMEEEGPMTGEEVRKMSAAIHKSGQRLYQVLEKYLMYVKVEMLARDGFGTKGAAPPVSTQIDVAIARIAQARAREKGRERDLRMELVDAAVAISPGHLLQIVEELIDNALKFSDAGSEVQVQTCRQADTLLLKIEDQGRGMAADQVRFIGAYMQFDRDKYEQQGIGLGLIIAKRLAEIHGGSLHIHSRPNAGTAVEVSLPCSRESAHALCSPTPSS